MLDGFVSWSNGFTGRKVYKLAEWFARSPNGFYKQAEWFYKQAQKSVQAS